MLFFVTFLPQFIDPKRASVNLRLAILGFTLAISAFVFHTLLGVFLAAMGAHAQQLAAYCPRIARFQQFRLAGKVTKSLATHLFLTERPNAKT